MDRITKALNTLSEKATAVTSRRAGKDIGRLLKKAAKANSLLAAKVKANVQKSAPIGELAKIHQRNQAEKKRKEGVTRSVLDPSTHQKKSKLTSLQNNALQQHLSTVRDKPVNSR
jgi:hypothetical protein